MFDADNDGVDEVAYIARTEDNDGYIVKLFDASDNTSTTLHEDWSEYSFAKPLDINQDGYLDIVIGNSSKTAYLINDGSGVFAAPTKEYAIMESIRNRLKEWFGGISREMVALME